VLIAAAIDRTLESGADFSMVWSDERRVSTLHRTISSVQLRRIDPSLDDVAGTPIRARLVSAAIAP